VALCLSIFVFEIFIISLPTRPTDLQPVEADGDIITLVLASRDRVVEVTDTVRDVVLLLLLCPAVVTIITGVTALRGAGACRGFHRAGPLVTFWAGEVRHRRKNGSQRLVYN